MSAGPGRGGQLRGRAARLAGLLPSGTSSAARTPFVLLVVVLLAGGLIALLMLNSSLNEGSFQLSKLKKQTQDLTDDQQALRRDVDDKSAPDALARRARELGMVPGGNPAFLEPDGTVRGRPTKAHALPPPPSPTPSATPAPSASAGASPTTSANPTASPSPGGSAPASASAPAAVPLAAPRGAAATPTTTPGR
ncbi:FtsB family cell division protein [Streptomyces sp. NRRL F-5126]|uniref:FtsB family cell division protein n=1 Tax=Streptomyces sp. NRRL F-5126 TaxID=1463857 RepID=UPI000B325EA1|nr:septum formation initiator family protein [Streptomyces sp. NRRL F-5126]